jgi:hypothetical protein
MPEKPASQSDRSLGTAVAEKLRANPLGLFLVATLLTIGGGIALWQANQADLVDRGQFQLTWDRLTVSPQPNYLITDVKQAAFEGSRLADLNLLDLDLCSKVHAAFAVQSWVEEVRVQKSRSGVDVALIFRQPAAMVEFGEDLLLPIDRNGIVLDGAAFDSSLTEQFLRIGVENPQVGSLVQGDTWPDERIVAAAMIAGYLQPFARNWGIVRIAHRPTILGSTAPEGDFELLTHRGTSGMRVVWGNPPGYEANGEVTAQVKVETLGGWIAERGPLDEIGSVQTIDLRSGKVTLMAQTASHR